jgi:hypothetical protein
MTAERAQLREVAEADADALLLGALRQRNGTATGADLEVATGLAHSTVEHGMRRLLDRFESRLAVAKGGALIYRFEPGFRLRPERRAALRALLGAVASVAAAVTTAVRVSFQVILAAQLFVYTFIITLPVAVVVGAVAGIVALVVAICSDKDGGAIAALTDPYVAAVVLCLFVLGGIGWVIKREYEVVVGVFKGKRAKGAAKTRAGHALFSVVRCVNDFAIGPAQARPPEERTNRAVRIALADERLVLARVRAAGGRLRSGDLVRWLGLDLDEADRQATRLAVEHDGTPAEGELEVIEFHFGDLLDTTGSAKADPRGQTSVERGATPAHHTGNSVVQDAVIGAFAGLNLGAGWYGLHALAGHEGHPLLWSAALFLGGRVPVFFSLLLVGLWLARWPATLLRRLLHGRRAARLDLIHRVVSHCETARDAPLQLGALDADRDLAYALGGASDVDAQLDRPRTVWRFARLAAELDGPERERGKGKPRRLSKADVVYEG